MTAVFINDSSLTEHTVPPEPLDLASRGAAPRELPVVLFSPDAAPAVEIPENPDEKPDSSAPPEAIGDQAQHALLYGRYLGQVQARIERAWMRPRTGIGAQRFSCRARIEQDRQGDVVGINLSGCNGGERWQQSLVGAIRTASPLPPPPDPSVYADRLSLTFASEGFQSGRPSEGFEPEKRDTLTADHRYQEREAVEHLAERFGVNLRSKGKESSEVIHLTIIGSPDGAPAPAGSANAPAMEPAPDIAPTPLPQ
jgi:hypothetical protein